MNSYTCKHDSITVSARDKIGCEQSYYEGCYSSNKCRYGDEWNRSRNRNYCKSSTGTCTRGNANDIGRSQRVLLARALCATSKVILLDEPVTGLDPKVTAEFYEILKKLNDKGITVIMVSHDLQSVSYATHILYLDSKDSFYGTKKEFMQSDKANVFGQMEGDEE